MSFTGIIRLPPKRILGDCLLIHCLPGRASRTLVELRGLLGDSTCVHKAEASKLDIKAANLVFYLSVYKLVDSSPFKKCNVMMT